METNLGKAVTVFLKVAELERLTALKNKGIKIIDIVRRGIDEIEKDLVKSG